ncbi:MAG: nucleoside hydrolase [Candidatus Bathyarchaeia archaeon]
MNRELVLLDVDTGHDDAMAICLAVASERLTVLGITTVAGNQTVDKTTVNTLKVLTLIGKENIPVAMGCHRPLVRELVTGAEIHGETGLDGADLPSPKSQVVGVHGVEFIIKMVRESPNPVTLIPTAPLTNVAIALLLAPDIVPKIKRIVLMGGAINGGNRTAAAEFNIYVDPEAAHIVFTSGVPITMVGLDVTEKTAFSLQEIEAMTASNSVTAKTFRGLLSFYARQREKRRGLSGAALHDAVAVAAVINPAVLRVERLPVSVEVKGELTRGMTVVDRRKGINRTLANVDVAVDVDVELFKHMMRQHLAELI